MHSKLEQSLYLNIIYQQPLKIKLSVILFFNLLIFTLGYSLDLSKLKSQLLLKQEKIQATIRSISNYQQQRMAYQQLQTRLIHWQPYFTANLAPYKQPLIASNLLEQINLQVAQQDLELSSATPLKAQKINNIISQPFQVNLETDYLKLLNFLTLLFNQPPILGITTLHLKKTAETPYLDAQLVIQAYTFLPGMETVSSSKKPKIDLAASLTKLTSYRDFNPSLKSILTIKRDPFTRYESQDQQLICKTNTPLTCFPLSNYRILGVLQLGEKYQAVIADPQGNIYQTSVGTFIGNQQSRIQQITAQAIVIKLANAKNIVLPVDK